MNALSVTSVTILLAIFSGVSCQKVPIPHPGIGGNDLLNPVKIIVDTLVNVQKTVTNVVRDVQQILNEMSLLNIQQNNRDLQQISLQNGRNIGVAEKAVPHLEPLEPRRLIGRSVVDVDVKDSNPNPGNIIKRSVVEVDVKDSNPNPGNIIKRSVVEVDVKDSNPNPGNIIKRAVVDVNVKDSKPNLRNIIKRSVVDVDVEGSTPRITVDNENPPGIDGSKIGVSF